MCTPRPRRVCTNMTCKTQSSSEKTQHLSTSRSQKRAQLKWRPQCYATAICGHVCYSTSTWVRSSPLDGFLECSVPTIIISKLLGGVVLVIPCPPQTKIRLCTIDANSSIVHVTCIWLKALAALGPIRMKNLMAHFHSVTKWSLALDLRLRL